MPALLSDNMVLQQGTNVRIWGWANPGEVITIKPDWPNAKSQKTTADNIGNWSLKINTPTAGGPYSMSVQGKNKINISNILIGEVWVCSGQSNMGMKLKGGSGDQYVIDSEKDIASSENKMIRLFTVKCKYADAPKQDVEGQWVLCEPETAKEFSAVGYHFGREVNRQINQPVGMIHSSWGGTKIEAWIRKDYMQQDDELRDVFPWHDTKLAKWKDTCAAAEAENKDKPEMPYDIRPCNFPSVLYNAMIAPITPMTVQGTIWYQGESNSGRDRQYRKLFPTMINNWRCDFNNYNMPFYFVQLAAFHNARFIGIRDAQLRTSRMNNTGMAVIIDVSDIYRIHPPDKKNVGKRLAYWALAKDYGKEIPYSGPLYTGYQIEGETIRVFFDYAADGIVAKDGKVTGFTIADKDRKFVEAKAVIEGDSVVVSSDAVKEPVAVRYGWDAKFQGCLYNKAKLPASPFRTDDWIDSEK